MLSLLGIYLFSMNSSDFISCFVAYSLRIYNEPPYAMWLRESVRYRLHKVTIALLVCEIITLASWASCSQLLLYPHSIQSDIFKLINILITSMLKALAGNFSLSVAKGVCVQSGKDGSAVENTDCTSREPNFHSEKSSDCSWLFIAPVSEDLKSSVGTRHVCEA